MIDRFEHFSYALNELNKYWHKIAIEEMKKYGLKSTHSIYLIGCLFFKSQFVATSSGSAGALNRYVGDISVA